MKKTATTLHTALIALILGGATAVFGLSGVTEAASTASFQISPPTANYPADPGATVKGVIKVTNLTGDPIALAVGKENFAAKGEEGEVELVDNAAPLYSLAPWFNVTGSQIDIPGKATKEVPYTIAVPKDAEPGGRYGSLVFHTIPPKLPSGESGAAVQQSIAALIFLRINGPANEQLSIESFATDKTFYEYGPVNITTRVKNTGNVHEKPTGTITIKNMLGMKVASIPLDEHYVIPGAIRRLHNDWPTAKKKPILIGRYTATLDAKYADGKTLTAATSFTVLPWKIIAVALIIAIILVLFFWKARRRFARAFRILAGRE